VRRTLWYVEPLSDARTPLADFFSILLELLFFQTSPKSLLLGEIIGIVQRREIGDALFGLVACVGVDDVDAISGGEGVQKIHQPNLVILVEPSSGFAVLEHAFDDEDSSGEGENLFEFLEKQRAVVRRV
jgi:hypothetical protein